MKINQQQVKNIVSNQTFSNKVEFNLSNKISKLLYMLRDGFYANKIQTMVQEYLSNARDSHRKENSDKKIQVILPTKSNPTLIIRDFGTGMNYEELTLFSSYLESSKENDESQIGGFGIGGKIAFAYSDSFVLISRKNNQKWIVSANKSENHNGVMNIIGPEKTEEPNGVEILIPIFEKDFDEVERSVVRLKTFWTDLIEITNDPIVDSITKPLNNEICFKNDLFSFYLFTKEENFKSFYKYVVGNPESNLSFLITIDGIPYNLNEKIYKTIQSILMNENNLFIYPLLYSIARHSTSKPKEGHQQFVFHFKSGELDITGSRETITDKDKNINKIIERINQASSDFKDLIMKRIEKNPLTQSIDFLVDLKKISKSDRYDFCVKSFFNKSHKILVMSDRFVLNEKVYSVYISSRRKNSNVCTDNLTLFLGENYNYINAYNNYKNKKNIFYFTRGENPSVNSLKANLREMSIYPSYNIDLYQKVEEEEIKILKELDLLSSENFLNFVSKEKRSKIINEKEISCEIISFDKEGLVEKREVTKVDLSELKKGVSLTRPEFNKLVQGLNKNDKSLLIENNINFFILGKETMKKLEGKFIPFSNIKTLIKKNSNFKKCFFGCLNDEHKIMTILLKDKLFKGKVKELKLNSLKKELSEMKSKYEDSTHLSCLKEAFRENNSELFEEHSSILQTFILKNPILENEILYFSSFLDEKNRSVILREDAFDQFLKCLNF